MDANVDFHHSTREIHDFAGELRTVNIANGNFRFVPLMYLEAALTDDITSREVYMKVIDHSCYYEGYMSCRAEEV